jgi:ectoine hydroxylase-related dioxygenase (phytanoyl-CoA dioxygenase family)
MADVQASEWKKDKQPGNYSVFAEGHEQLRAIKKALPLRVLSADDFAHWQRYGYVIVHNAVPPENIARTVRFLWEFQEMNPADSATWDKTELRAHEMKEITGAGMVEAYHHQTLWDNRQHPRIHNAFVDIWDEEALWVTIDRANLNPPNAGKRKFGGFIHWDADTTADPLPVNCQGVLALSDTSEDGGGFQCIPELFEHLDDWRAAAPKDRNPWQPDLKDVPWPARFVPMKAGDLLIFNSLLAHGIRPNTSTDKVRVAQYISFAPAQESLPQMREWRVNSWKRREPPSGIAFPGDPREWEQTRYPRASLSPLGEKILGLRSWASNALFESGD